MYLKLNYLEKVSIHMLVTVSCERHCVNKVDLVPRVVADS